MARWFHVAASVAAPARFQGGRASQGPSLREEEGPRAVILLDGIEYLMINNDFARILHLLEYVNEQIALHRAAMILSVDERAFDAKELAYIERNTVTLE